VLEGDNDSCTPTFGSSFVQAPVVIVPGTHAPASSGYASTQPHGVAYERRAERIGSRRLLAMEGPAARCGNGERN
jgi:hypothetical protein